MKTLQERLDQLSPEKRELLLKKLQPRSEASDTERGKRAPALVPLRREGPAPLSFAQARLWFLDRLEGESVDYKVPALWQLRGRLDVAALERAIATIIERHEVLRTTFTFVGDTQVQVVHPAAFTELPIIDLQSIPVAEQLAAAQRLAASPLPFDLETGPLLRATLLGLAPDFHILFLVFHHIVCDGWSMGVFRRELSALYAAFCAGAPSPLPALPIQYADYAQWQREWLRGEVLSTQLGYWRKQLAGAPPLLELPTDRPRPAVQTFHGRSLSFTLDKELTQALKRLSQESAATLFMTLLAALSHLLSRYSNQEDVVIGSPIANRSHRETEALIGMFVNTLVLRIDLQGKPTFRDLLARVKQVALDAYEHQDLPLEKLVDELQPVRSLSHNPLFQVMFAFQNTAVEELQLPGLRFTALPVENRTTHFDLGLTVKETPQGLYGEWEYSSDLFDSASIVRMMAQFEILLQGLAADPARAVATISLLTAAERHQLLVKWNQTQADYPLDQCIHKLFEKQVERTPEAAAVVFYPDNDSVEQRLTYRELNQRANQLAHYLQKLGVGPESLVGLCLERSVEMLIGLLGILKAGGAYVPLDPAYPAERLAYIVADASLQVLVTQQRLRVPINPESLQLVYLDADEQSAQPTDNVSSSAQSRNLAYVIYTSGSSGTPRGVLIEHRSLVNFVYSATAGYKITARDRILQFAALTFDTAAEEIYPGLLCGATLILRNEAMLNSVAAFIQKSTDWQVTWWGLPTEYWHLICDEMASADLVLPALLRIAVVGGERFLPERVRQWRQRVGTFPVLMNGYGPTEATVVATMCCISALNAEQLAAKEVSIGRPIGNTQVYVLDPAGEPVPIGIPGELCIGGVGLGRGYLNRPELTQEKFIPHPFSTQPGARLYKTGDAVRYLPDGNLEFLGRLDGQVKIRGFRIELGEIETVLRTHPQVAQAVVMARADLDEPAGIGHKQLVAYVVPGASPPTPLTPLTIEELRQFLTQKLPSYMMPSAFVLLKELPLTSHRKVDYRALPVPDRQSQRSALQVVAPRTESELALATIWSEILRVKNISIHDNFFTLGGDSILSIQMVSRAARAGLTITPKQIFQHQSLAELAAAVGTGERIAADQGAVNGLVPLTPVQLALLAMQQPELHVFNLSLMIETPKDVQPELLEQAVRLLQLQHDALRLRFVKKAEHWEQSYGALEPTTPFSIIDLSHLPAPEKPAALREADRALQASLNLASGPILRVALVNFGAAQPGRLILIIHHLAMDIVSWWILIEDLISIYQQLDRGQPVRLPAKTTSYQQWASKLVDYAKSDALLAEASYWTTALDHTYSPLPVDYPPCPDNNIFACLDRVSVELPEAETRALLQDLPTIYKTQIIDVLLTAYVQAFTPWSGTAALLVELAHHGRDGLFEDIDLSRTVGWFVAEYPVLLQVGAASPAALQSVREQLRRIPKQGVGYGVLRYLHPDEALRKRLQELPQPQVTFTYFGQYDQMLQEKPEWTFANDDRPSFYSPKNHRGHLLFNVHGVVMDGRLQLNWTYSKKLHRRETVLALAERVIHQLKVLLGSTAQSEEGAA